MKLAFAVKAARTLLRRTWDGNGLELCGSLADAESEYKILGQILAIFDILLGALKLTFSLKLDS